MIGRWVFIFALAIAASQSIGEESVSDSVVRGMTKSPGKAVLLSALIPGGGQIYTGHTWKAAIIGPAEIAFASLAVKEQLAASHVLRNDARLEKWEDTYVKLRDRRNAFLWWTGAVLAFSMADAYVSAQMFGFDRQMSFALGPMRAGLVLRI
ncbi:hypothetical protein CH330_08855 [candidate division WOR-3 bacterium JGI_Cruoil_03_51_56]|uniref:DUF5683 domain-containing protein n=1 Tax=candidate division WOR-3 bacterium JGI_Cruoil_03_51_56 TaxID=1973747 RepID=A0A235BPV3_UNCW3|nr:MAG: hypothetical protein CH330_08855 [candidate division WOR-3 bacterium JGI_Cruoil_03_51_56]